MEKSTGKQTVLKNIIKWLILLLLAAFGYCYNREFIHDALSEVGHTPFFVLLLAFLLGNLYFLFEGVIISRMTVTGRIRVNVPRGIACGYMCEFYRLSTLGNGGGIAQVYYYYSYGIPVSEALGICISQYTFQKITIGLMGIVSFVFLVISGNRGIMKYAGYMAVGALMIAVVCAVLFLVMVSRRISEALLHLLDRMTKHWPRANKKLEELRTACDRLQTQARLVWSNKPLFFSVILLDLAKQISWYLIPGVYLSFTRGVSLLPCVGIMAVCNMLAGVMVAPSGIGTLDFVFGITFAKLVPNGEVVAAMLIIYRLFTWFLPFLFGLPVALCHKKVVRT